MMKNLGKEVLTFWEKGERELARWVAVGDGRGPAILGQNPAPHRLFGALATSELWAPSPACSASTLLHTMYYIALCSIRAKSTKVHPSMCKICHSLRGTFLAPFCFLFLHGYTFWYQHLVHKIIWGYHVILKYVTLSIDLRMFWIVKVACSETFPLILYIGPKILHNCYCHGWVLTPIFGDIGTKTRT